MYRSSAGKADKPQGKVSQAVTPRKKLSYPLAHPTGKKPTLAQQGDGALDKLSSSTQPTSTKVYIYTPYLHFSVFILLKQETEILSTLPPGGAEKTDPEAERQKQSEK